jgi:hypothetical protein
LNCLESKLSQVFVQGLNGQSDFFESKMDFFQIIMQNPHVKRIENKALFLKKKKKKNVIFHLCRCLSPSHPRLPPYPSHEGATFPRYPHPLLPISGPRCRPSFPSVTAYHRRRRPRSRRRAG